MSNSDSDLSELDDYGYEEDNIEAEQDDGDVSMSDLEPDDYADEGPLDDGDMIQVQGKGKGRAPYQVDYTVLSPKELEEGMRREISHVASALSLIDKDAAALLRCMKWNKERVLEQYFEDPEKLRQAAGIDPAPEGTSGKSQPRIKRIRGFVCSICYEEDDQSKETLALSCDHRFCRECYTNYVTHKINDEGEAKSIQCMATDCSILMDERTVELLVSDATMDRYRQLLNRSYVDDDASLRWCPHPGCEYAVRCYGVTSNMDSLVPTVTCACGNKFCFSCGRPYDHAPCLCIIVKKWLRKCEDDSETANWIQANTKECPKCQATIEKNGGCNHMTCKKCKYEFCWICMGEWSVHGTSWYNCNRYDPKSENKDPQSQSRESLKRYLHYYNRYANHEQSAKLEKETYSRIERRMEDLQNSSTLSWIEVQFLKKAVDVLGECRNVLKWTYGMAFYLKEDENSTRIFEDNQNDLEMATENLSEAVEQPFEAEDIPKLRAKVLDLTAYVQKRYQVMLDDTLSGYLEERWHFKVDLSS